MVMLYPIVLESQVLRDSSYSEMKSTGYLWMETTEIKLLKKRLTFNLTGSPWFSMLTVGEERIVGGGMGGGSRDCKRASMDQNKQVLSGKWNLKWGNNSCFGV